VALQLCSSSSTTGQEIKLGSQNIHFSLSIIFTFPPQTPASTQSSTLYIEILVLASRTGRVALSVLLSSVCLSVFSAVPGGHTHIHRGSFSLSCRGITNFFSFLLFFFSFPFRKEKRKKHIHTTYKQRPSGQ
jgi:hypothetical protein